jgi:DNA-binding XRE family transcriptional regulator
MTHQQLEAAIAQLGDTQTSLARSLDISDRTMRRYLAGDAPIPRVVDLAIAHLLNLRAAAV